MKSQTRTGERLPRTPERDSAEGLEVALDNPPGLTLPKGRATAVFLSGTCFHRREAVDRIAIVIDGVRYTPSASCMPRMDLFRALHPELELEGERASSGDPCSTSDPEIRCYRSGFWGVFQIGPFEWAGKVDLLVEAQLSNGRSVSASLGAIDVIDPEAHRSSGRWQRPKRDGLIAICMATHEPNIELFRRQVGSLKAQTHEDWICFVSDDYSGPDKFQAIAQTVEGDARFQLSRTPRRLGFYRNFERVLGLVPADFELISLCDQDDRWDPDKLAVLRSSLADAQLVYGEARLVDVNGRRVAGSLAEGRRAGRMSFVSQLGANTIPGPAALFRRRVLDVALPFPQGPGWDFHDHWLNVVAMALGKVAHVDRPLYDYVQHSAAVLEGRTGIGADADGASRVAGSGRIGLRARISDWRKPYFFGYVPVVIKAHVLLARSGELPRRRQRTLRRLIAAESSPVAFVWLVSRRLRPGFGSAAAETAGLLVRGLLWRLAMINRARGRERPGRAAYDASLPVGEHFGPRRRRRYRAGSLWPRSRRDDQP